MKNITSIFWGLLGLLTLTQCSDPDNSIYTVLDDFTNGAVLRTVEITSAEFNSFDTSTFFEVEIEEQDTQNGDLLQEVRIYLGFDDNTGVNGTTSKPEVLYATLAASAFSNGEFGLPRTTFRVTLAEALDALNVTNSEFFGGDAIDIRMELQLTDGRIFTNSDATGTLQGSFFNSPYLYKSVIKCIPLSAVPGTYVFEMADSFGDGWQGSHIKVTVDGDVTYYGMPSPYGNDAPRNAILEPYEGSVSTGTARLVIPDGAQNMSFEWVSGDWPSECSYTIRFSNPDGSAEQAAFSESNPANGEKVLSICN